jgi:outer membrane beta-barrel protein
MKKKLLPLALLALLPQLAWAQTEELENPGTINAVQERLFRMDHELTLGVGVLPIDAFYKGLMVQAGYTYHFSDYFAWQIIRAAYSFNFGTGLQSQLERDFGVQPTAFQEVQYFGGSDLVWTPLYGKGSWLNRTVTRFELFGMLGATVFNMTNGLTGSGSSFRPAVNVGLGFRIYSGQHISYRLDLTDNVTFTSNGVTNIPTLQLSLALNFGGTE